MYFQDRFMLPKGIFCSILFPLSSRDAEIILNKKPGQNQELKK